MLKLSLVAILLSLSAFAQNPFGNRAHLGGYLGTSLSDDVRTIDLPPPFRSSGSRQIIAGASFEFDLGHEFSVEANALYRPIRLDRPFQLTSHNWEFPVLAKKYFPIHNWRPFVEGGPSFRYSQRFNLSPYGVAAGGGVEFRWKKLRIAPTVRYTYWNHDDHAGAVTTGGSSIGDFYINHNQTVFLVGFSY